MPESPADSFDADFPEAATTATIEAAPSKRISSFKRAICALVGVSPERDENDIVGIVQYKLEQAKAAHEQAAGADAIIRKLKALRKQLLTLAMDQLEE